MKSEYRVLRHLPVLISWWRYCTWIMWYPTGTQEEVVNKSMLVVWEPWRGWDVWFLFVWVHTYMRVCTCICPCLCASVSPIACCESLHTYVKSLKHSHVQKVYITSVLWQILVSFISSWDGNALSSPLPPLTSTLYILRYNNNNNKNLPV